MRMTSRTGSARKILRDFEKVSELRLDTGRVEMRPASGERRLVFAYSRRPLWWVPHVLRGGTDEKARIERKCISLTYVETFNSKVIKGFVPELRSR